eukprot:TRINITY_DN116589_c0_g1_i1.p1 TRINITY_DN116589_c0_g1~~TRINITY_DN116589_c0_g1_i1.p1  ORF type:complete len:363 (-),score=45.77 TRINITY_DN116589_c0_g1_i1:75-1073(-)
MPSKKRVERVLSLNSGSRGDQCALWMLPAFLNHSCAPTTVCVPVDAEVNAFIATTCLESGDELTDSYVELLQPRQSRQEDLKQPWGFTCHCKRCEVEAALMPAKAILQLRRDVEAACAVHGGLDEARFQGQLVACGERVSHALRSADGQTHNQRLLRSCLLAVDITLAKLYESPHCSFPGKGALCVEACEVICQALEQVVPLQDMHIEFAHVRFQQSASDADAHDGALLYLLCVWLLRQGALLLHTLSSGSCTSPSLQEATTGQLEQLTRLFGSQYSLQRRQTRIIEAAISDGAKSLLDRDGILNRFGAALRQSQGSQEAPQEAQSSLDTMD